MGTKQKSKNPENRECSSVKQVLLDMKSAGFSPDAVKILLKECEDDPVKRAEADEIFSDHKYPQHSIVFVKVTNTIEFSRMLSSKAVSVLNFMGCTMNTNNLIQVTSEDLMKCTNLGNKKTIKKALDELIEKGFIAVRLKGNTRRGTVYMVNPSVARCGKEIPGLTKVFWTMTGTQYDGRKITEYSEAHKTWKENVKKRTYSIGCGKQDTTDGEIRFSKINEPKIKMKKGSLEATDELDEELPFEGSSHK